MTEEQVMKDFDLNKGKEWESCWNPYFQTYCKQFDREVWIVTKNWRCFRIDEIITKMLVKEDFNQNTYHWFNFSRERYGPWECSYKKFGDEVRVMPDRGEDPIRGK